MVTCLTATKNPRQIYMLQPGTYYARPIYPQISTYHFYKVHVFHFFIKRCTLWYCIDELMQENTHLHRCLVVEYPAGVFTHHARPAHERFVLPMKNKGTDGSPKICANASSLFSFSISSCARVALSNFSSMTRTESDVRHENVELFFAVAAVV